MYIYIYNNIESNVHLHILKNMSASIPKNKKLKRIKKKRKPEGLKIISMRETSNICGM